MPQVVNSAGKAFGDNAAGCFGAVVFMTVNDFIICKPPAFKLFVVSQRVEIALEIVFQIFDNSGQGIVAEVERAPFSPCFLRGLMPHSVGIVREKQSQPRETIL